ncbi:titin-like [Ylistrum balloti]|uniref:titin-like n=1 Tax=Ylistrum balloti TaxID=509963 RepID=UPI002905DE06|nr:titin-like [Ylistrum balloti]
MAAASENITAWLDWDDHLLDFLLIGWIGWAALVVMVVNSVLTFFGPLQPRGDFVIRTKEGATGAKVVSGTGGAESCQWLNSALNWFYLHYEKFPEFVDVWVKALNEQSVKLGGPVQVKFERVKSGSLPPKFSEVTFEAGPEDKYVVTCKTDSRDLSLAVFASQQTAEGVKLTNLTTNILKLKGTLKMKCFREGSDMMVNVSFEGRPDVKVVGKPVNPYQDPNDLVDVGVVETVVRNAICLTSSNFNISKLLLGGSYGNLSPRVTGDIPLSPSNLSPRTEAVFEPIEVKDVQQSAFHAPSLASAPRSTRPPPAEKRLLVKVIKASALGSRDVGSIDPTCVVILDNPPQTQATSVVKSTVNPFWDEQFLFDVTSNTKEMKFEVRDRRQGPAGEKFLGEAYVYFDDLKKTPSSRQILPLQGSPDIRGDFVTGTLTVEFLFLNPVDAEAVQQTIAAMSPKRTVEVNQAKTPGGTLVTKTTTTTERSRHGRQGAEVDGSPNYIEKHTNIYGYDGSDSHSLNTSTNQQDRSVSSSSEHLYINGVESVAETAIRELMDRSRKPRTPTKTSTLIITGVKRASAEPSEEVTAPSSVVTAPQDEPSPVQETTVSSEPVVELLQQSSNLPSHAVLSSSPPISECSSKPETLLESSFPKFTPIGMHPPAEVKTFPDKKKSPSPIIESEHKIAEMLPEPIPTIDLLDENVVFEVSYSLGEADVEPTESELDSSHPILSDTEVKSGLDDSAEIPVAYSSDIDEGKAFEAPSVLIPDKDIVEEVATKEAPPVLIPDKDIVEKVAVDEAPPVLVPDKEIGQEVATEEAPPVLTPDKDIVEEVATEEAPPVLTPDKDIVEEVATEEAPPVLTPDKDIVEKVAVDEAPPVLIPDKEIGQEVATEEAPPVLTPDKDIVEEVATKEVPPVLIPDKDIVEEVATKEAPPVLIPDKDIVEEVATEEAPPVLTPDKDIMEKVAVDEAPSVLIPDKDIGQEVATEDAPPVLTPVKEIEQNVDVDEAPSVLIPDKDIVEEVAVYEAPSVLTPDKDIVEEVATEEAPPVLIPDKDIGEEVATEEAPPVLIPDKDIVEEVAVDQAPSVLIPDKDIGEKVDTEEAPRVLIPDKDIGQDLATEDAPPVLTPDEDIVEEVAAKEISSVLIPDKDIGEEVATGDAPPVLIPDKGSEEGKKFEVIDTIVEDSIKPVSALDAGTEIESTQDIKSDTFPESDSDPQQVKVTEEMLSPIETEQQETCQEVAPDSTCVEIVTHSRSPSPYGDDSSCSSFHDDEYISHSSTEDLTEGESAHYFKSKQVDDETSEPLEFSTDLTPETCETSVTMEQTEEDSEAAQYAAVESKVFKPEGQEEVKLTPKQSEGPVEADPSEIMETDLVKEPELVKETEAASEQVKEIDTEQVKECESETIEHEPVTTKVITPEPSGDLELVKEPELVKETEAAPEQVQEIDTEQVKECESETIEHEPVTTKVITPEPSGDLELVKEPELVKETEAASEQVKEIDTEQVKECESENIEHEPVTTKVITPEPSGDLELVKEPELEKETEAASEQVKEIDTEQVKECESETIEHEPVTTKVITPEPSGDLELVKEPELVKETEAAPEQVKEIDTEQVKECESETVQHEPVTAKVVTPEPSGDLELSSEPELLSADAEAQHSAVTSEILPESVIHTKSAQKEQTEPELIAQTQCASSEDFVITKVEQSKELVVEEVTTPCPLLPTERVLAAEKIPSSEAVLSETMPMETILSADDTTQSDSTDQYESETVKPDGDTILTEVEPSEQVTAEETTTPCSSLPTERLLAPQTVPAQETVLSETLPKETKLPADDLVIKTTTESELVLSEVKPSEEIAVEESVSSCPSMPDQRLLAAQKVSKTETVLSETMPEEASLSVEGSTVSTLVSGETDGASSMPVVEVEEPAAVYTSLEQATSFEASEESADFKVMTQGEISTEDKVLLTDEVEDNLSEYDDLPGNIPTDYLIEETTEDLEEETEQLAKFPIEELADLDIEPVVTEPKEGKAVEATTAAEPVDQSEAGLVEEAHGKTELPTSDGQLESEDMKTVKTSDELATNKSLQLDLVSTPLLQEMEQIASDMSSLAEDISKSPVLASAEIPMEMKDSTTDAVDQSTTEKDFADEAPSTVTCHATDVSMASGSSQEMSVEDIEGSPVESLTPTPENEDGLELETPTVTLEVSAEETALQLVDPQVKEETALEFSLATREKLASISSVSDIIQDLPAHSAETEEEPVLGASAVSVDVVGMSDPISEEMSAVDDLMKEVSGYSPSEIEGQEVIMTGQFVSEPVDVSELAAGAFTVEDTSSQPAEGLKLNVFVTTDLESSTPSSPLTKYDVVEDLSATIDEPLTDEKSIKMDEEDTSEKSAEPDVVTHEEITAVGSFDLSANLTLEETQPDTSITTETQPEAEVTLTLPAADSATSTEVSIPAPDETPDVDSPVTRAMLRRQNYLAEQAKKKELFEASGHIKNNEPVHSHEAPLAILPIDSEEIQDESLPTGSKSKEVKVAAAVTHVGIKPSEQTFDNKPKTIVVQVESTEITGPPKEMVSDLMSGQKRANSPERYGSLTRPLRVYKQVSSDIEDDNTKANQKRVDDWVTATTDDMMVTNPESLTVQTPASLPESSPSIQPTDESVHSPATDSVQITQQPLPENVQSVYKPGFVIRSQQTNPLPQTENVQVQRAGFVLRPQTVENLPQNPHPLPESAGNPYQPESAENPKSNVEDIQLPPETLPDTDDVPVPGRVYRPKTDYNTLPRPSKSSKDVSTPKRAGSLPRSSSSAEKQRKTTQSSPTEEANSDIPTVKMDPPPSGQDEKEKKKGSSLARTIKKRFSRSKKRSKSAERSRDDSHLQPPGQSYGQAQSKDDIELVRAQQDTPSLKKSRSLGGSLKKLFRRGRKRSRDRGETSRESSYSRSSTRNASQGPSREGSIGRGSGQSSSLTRSGQLPEQKEIGRSHWSKSTPQSTSNEYMERGIDVSPRHEPGETSYPVLQQEPAVLQPRGMSSQDQDISKGHWSRPKSGEQLDEVRQSYDTYSAPPEDVRKGHWSKSKSPPRAGAVIITTPKKEPLDVVSPSYDTMAAPPTSDDRLEVRRGHWSKSRSPARSVGPVIITTPKQEVPDVVPSSTTKAVTPEPEEKKEVSKKPEPKEVKEVIVKTKSLEKIEPIQPTEDSVPEPAEEVRKAHWSKSKSPVRSGPVIVKKKESVETEESEKPEPEVGSVQVDVRRGHWSKSKSPSRERERIGQIVVSKEPTVAAPTAEVDIRKGHWTKSKSKSPKRDSHPTGGVVVSVPDSQTPSPAQVEPASEVKPSPTTTESSDVKAKPKPTKAEPVKSKTVKVVPVKAKPAKVEPAVVEPVKTVPEEPFVPPPPSAKKGHWSKSSMDTKQPTGGGVVVVTTEAAEVPVTPVETVDVRRGHWTKPKTKAS